MMKLAKRAAALVLAAVLALSLTACSPKEVASNLILKTADLLGLREEGSDDDEADEIVAQPGGEVNFPDGLQDTSVHWNQQVQDGTLYVAFNSIQNRNTEYFVAGSDTVQVTAMPPPNPPVFWSSRWRCGNFRRIRQPLPMWRAPRCISRPAGSAAPIPSPA